MKPSRDPRAREQAGQAGEVVVLRPTPLTLAAWLSYVPVVTFVVAARAHPLAATLLAVPWLVTAHGLLRGDGWAWRLGLALGGIHLALLLASLVFPPPVAELERVSAGIARSTVVSLLFLASYAACLLAPSTRRFIRTGRRDP